MANDNENSSKKASRRQFLKKAGKVAVVAPAAGVILNASKANATPCVASGCLRT